MSQTILEPAEKPNLQVLSEWNKTDERGTMDASFQKESIKVPYYVWLAEKVRYIHYGWSLSDYMRYAAIGSDSDKVKRAGFNNICLWGDMGSGKSNLAMQLLNSVYQNMAIAEKHMLLNVNDVLRLYDEIKGGGRCPALCFDDTNTIFSKELWFEDRQLYIKLRKIVNLIRPKISNFICTVPTLEDLVSIFSEKLTFEVLVFPNQTYQVERYCRFVDQYSARSGYFKKILTEYSGFNMKSVTNSDFTKYEDRRYNQIDLEFKDFQDYLNERENPTEDSEKPSKSFKSSPKPKFDQTCPHCNYMWTSAIEHPKYCPKCSARNNL